MIEFPTANQIAWAVVQACRETGESPLDCYGSFSRIRARHYALHALIQVFPEANKAALARCIGAPKNPSSFYVNSRHSIVSRYVGGPRAGQCRATWWSDYIFDRVITKIILAAPKAKRLELAVETFVSLSPAPKRIEDSLLFEAVRNTQ